MSDEDDTSDCEVDLKCFPKDYRRMGTIDRMLRCWNLMSACHSRSISGSAKRCAKKKAKCTPPPYKERETPCPRVECCRYPQECLKPVPPPPPPKERCTPPPKNKCGESLQGCCPPPQPTANCNPCPVVFCCKYPEQPCPPLPTNKKVELPRCPPNKK